ncbi:hydrogenase expression protein [Halobacteriales archaeon QS_8_69_26]|nr:MAG: hydrogenase expression protein [Halobacteriales archaeon QS_8_69_26]
MVGKVDPDRLELALDRLGAPDEDVIQGPAYGEDAAALRVGDRTLVVNADPISLAAEQVGTLGIPVACNDVAACGADPRWLTAVVLVPEADPGTFETVTEQLDRAARSAGVAIVGGHSEYSVDLPRPLVALTCLGIAEEYVPTGGARPGDAVILTKGAGIEGSAILATDFRGDLAGSVDAETVAAAADYFSEVSVVPDARVLREYATAMHDPTEGGVIDGLLELAVASGVEVVVDREDVPVREPTRRVCSAMDVDPLAIFGSGALVATVPADAADDALVALEEAGIEGTVIGEVHEGDGALNLDGETRREPIRDQLYALWE